MLPRRRSSEPSDLLSPSTRQSSEDFISASPPSSPLRNRSPARSRSKLLNRHSSGGSIPDSPPKLGNMSKAKHVRTKSRFAGRFEVMDFDLLHTNSQESASQVLQDGPINEAAVPSIDFVAENTVPLADGVRRVMGRFQVCDLVDSPPPKSTAQDSQGVGLRRVQSAELVPSTMLENVPVPVPAASAPATPADEMFRTKPHTSLIGRFQIIEMPTEVATEPPELLRQAEILLSSPNPPSGGSSSSMGSDTAMGIVGESMANALSHLSPPVKPEETKQAGVGEPSRADILDGIDSIDVLAALSRRMQSMANEIQRLKQENVMLKEQVKSLTANNLNRTTYGTSNYRA